MEILWFTLTAILLYLMSDWILRQIETRRGKPFANRGIVFFLVIFPLALIAFEILERILKS